MHAPKQKPMLIDVPAIAFAAVAGSGDPNEEGRYLQASTWASTCFFLYGKDV